MKRFLRMFYGWLLVLLMIVGEVVTVYLFAWRKGGSAAVWGIVGFALAYILAPAFHELGHVALAHSQKMRLKMTKFSFFRLTEQGGKLRFSFASPFSQEETRVVPLTGGGMKKRAALYTAGGLIFGGAYLLLLLAAAIFVGMFSERSSFFFWGGVPYAAYLFLLNAAPFTYAGGKTDAAILSGIRKDEGAEKAMVYAMEIYGELSEGKSFSEIDEKFYFDLPQLPEDEPMFAMTLELRYRYYLEKEDFARAADCLNRLAESAGYLSDEASEELAAELLYMHSLNGDAECADESGKLCERYLKRNSASAKRILAAYSAMRGEADAVGALKEQAEACLEKETIAGIKKAERILLGRIPG